MEKDKFAAFCDAVCTHVKHATPKERSAIRQELTDHLEDHAESLTAMGFGWEEAERRSVDAMGDAAEIGEALNRQYGLGWVIAYRIAAVFTVLALVVAVMAASLPVRTVSENLKARFSPETSLDEFDGLVYSYETDLRAEYGSVVLKVFAVGFLEKEGQYYAALDMTAYDRCILEQCPSTIWGGLNGTTSLGTSKLFETSNLDYSGATYDSASIPVAYGEGRVTLLYERYGRSFTLDIPLDWEGVA